MSYKKKFLNKSGMSSPISGMNSNAGAWNGQDGSMSGGYSNTDFGYKNYMSRLPEVYTGHPNRIERYNQYEMMDVDAEINACLDIIAEFSTQRNEHNKTPFSFEFKDDPTPHEVELLTKQLQQWCKLNEFDVRMFKIFRNVVKYGDQAFVRDPENFKLYWIDMVKVIKVIVNESEGKKPEQYVIKDININLQNLSVAQKTNTDFAANPATGLGGSGGGTNTPYTVPAMPYNTTGSRFTLGQSEAAVDAKHIVHLSLTEGLDRFWPFGQSILENIFKVYKQKELLEDAVLIYRVQRAPERRMFKIDVGNMPSHMAMKLDEEFKLFLRWRGFNIDTQMFSIMFNPPQNFAAYRQSELDNARVSTFTAMETLPYISKRFALERFLGLTEEEIKRNEMLWEEENKEEVPMDPSGSDLRNIGISSGDFQSDIDTADEIESSEETPAEGPDVAGPVDSAGGEAVPGGAAGPVGGGMQI